MQLAPNLIKFNVCHSFCNTLIWRSVILKGIHLNTMGKEAQVKQMRAITDGKSRNRQEAEPT